MRKRQPTRHQEDGELWLVSYADMVTLLLGLFVVLYSLSQVDDRKLNLVAESMKEAFGKKGAPPASAEEQMDRATRESRALAFLTRGLGFPENTDASLERIERLATADKSLHSVAAELRKIASEGSQLVAKRSQVTLSLPEAILFDASMSQLSEGGRRAITELVPFLKTLRPPLRIEILGHTDQRPTSTGGRFSSNWELSAVRASSVLESLVKQGISEGQISARGMGSSSPLFPERGENGDTLAGNRLRNRRIEIRILRGVDE